MNLTLLLPSLAAASYLLSSCAAAPRRTAFNEADFAWAKGAGTGSIVGQSLVVMRDNSTNYGDNSDVILLPANAYTSEEMERGFQNGERLEPRDSRATRYLRTVTADGLGQFAFHHLPAGDYYVGSTVDWSYWYWNDDMTKATVHHTQYIHARVTVKNGQVARVAEWSQGASQTR